MCALASLSSNFPFCSNFKFLQAIFPHSSRPTPVARQGASAFSSGTSYVDVDANDMEDPIAAAFHAEAIFHNLRQAELKRRPLVTYMESVQTDINPAMRGILVDWLVEVGQEYRLASDTLFLSVAYLDRFLSLVDVKRNKLQLVGVACVLIASKYEEIYAPQVDEFCYITDNTYTRAQVLACEKEVLDVLGFDLTQPTIKTFLRRFIKAASGEIAVNVTFEFLASYLAELCLMDYGMLNYLPSHVAASCVMVALWALGKPCWSATLTHYTGYMPFDLRQCIGAVHLLFRGAVSSGLPAARDKYASSKFGKVSLMTCSNEIPSHLFHIAA